MGITRFQYGQPNILEGLTLPGADGRIHHRPPAAVSRLPPAYGLSTLRIKASRRNRTESVTEAALEGQGANGTAPDPQWVW